MYGGRADGVNGNPGLWVTAVIAPVPGIVRFGTAPAANPAHHLDRLVASMAQKCNSQATRTACSVDIEQFWGGLFGRPETRKSSGTLLIYWFYWSYLLVLIVRMKGLVHSLAARNLGQSAL